MDLNPLDSSQGPATENTQTASTVGLDILGSLGDMAIQGLSAIASNTGSAAEALGEQALEGVKTVAGAVVEAVSVF